MQKEQSNNKQSDDISPDSSFQEEVQNTQSENSLSANWEQNFLNFIMTLINNYVNLFNSKMTLRRKAKKISHIIKHNLSLYRNIPNDDLQNRIRQHINLNLKYKNKSWNTIHFSRAKKEFIVELEHYLKKEMILAHNVTKQEGKKLIYQVCKTSQLFKWPQYLIRQMSRKLFYQCEDSTNPNTISV